MKNFIGKLMLFFSLVVVADWLYGMICNYMLHHVQSGRIYQSFYVCDSTCADVLFMGTSRCRMTYDPKILSDTLGLTCYNCGYDGMGIIYHYGAAKVLMQRYKPKMIVYDVLPVVDLYKRDDNSIFFANLHPFYDRKGIDSLIWSLDANERIKMLFSTYRYHAKFLELYGDLKSKENHYYQGYYVEDGEIHGNDTIFTESHQYVIDSLKLYYMEKFIIDYRKETQLVFVASPRYRYKSDSSLYLMRQLCAKYNIPFISHYNDSNFVWDKTLFLSQAHFNRKGATKFSQLIGVELRNYILDNNIDTDE